jgi:small subunit ribosomal protein S18
MMPQQRKRRPMNRPTKQKCSFCEKKSLPSYKEVEVLKTLLTMRGKIQSRSRSGVCHKHQRLLAIAVKRARHLARLPFDAKLS